MDGRSSGSENDLSLEGKVAVVTGASSGIGAATARRLASAGAHVVVAYNKGADRAQQLIKEMPGGNHRAVRMALEDTASLVALAAEVQRAYGRADILVNSAGFTRNIPHADLDALDDATMDAMYIANVRGPFATIRAFTHLLRASRQAVIVNISSIAAIRGTGSNIAYAGSKAALDVMTKALAKVLGPEIRVINVSPGGVDTAFVPGRDRATLERIAQATPLKVVIEPDDVARAVMACILYLKHTTGTTIIVDGGQHL